MCCDICHKYEDCSAAEKLKESCCKICPEYGICYPDEDNKEDVEELGF